MHHTELLIAAILLLAMFCQWAAWRVGLPAILFLLLSGLITGPVLNWVNPDQLLGDLLMPMVALSVAVILFEGSLTLKARELRGVGRVVQRMISIGALVTWIIVASATHWIMGFSWQISALFGAIVIVTGPTVIVPMLRTVRPNRKIANILRWEGIAIDPIGALMAVLTYEFIIASVEQSAIPHVLLVFLQIIAIGGLVGVVAGYLLGQLLSRNAIPEYLQNLATLSVVLVAFAGTNALQEESGLLTVTVMGMWLANKKDVDIHPILNFKENLSLLLISVLFILLAARIPLEQMLDIGWKALILLAVVQFIARPAKILVSTWGLDITWPERGLLSWIAPRGIVAAAISAIFAEKLVANGYEEASLLVPLTFAMIIGTVVLQSATAGFVARKLGVAEPLPRGFLIIGSNAFSRAIASELKKYDVRCVIADSSWDAIRQARMAGLDTFYGNPVSEKADTHLDLSGIGSLLALSAQRYINIISSVHYRTVLGVENIYSIGNSTEKNQTDKHQINGHYRGQKLFGEDVAYFDLASLISQGHSIRSTTLSEEFNWAAYKAKYEDRRLPLFIIKDKNKIQPITAAGNHSPAPGHTILALSLVPDAPAEAPSNAASVTLPA